ncbi:MAG: 6,7-dimethyl-8-ribityllumazine synthase [Elusimicrobia bacterium]|nr:6,7-dimethyl-8-ribityllumazine synthase [Elusimicrobiota bacterium]
MIAIAVSRFNEEVTSQLLKSCKAALAAHGLTQAQVKAFSVPGAYELPWLANELALSGKYEVVIALGCVLKGATAQNDHIARSTVQRLHEIAVRTRVPVILGVITPNTYAQAVARTKGSLDRGKEAANAAVEMLKLRQELKTAHG